MSNPFVLLIYVNTCSGMMWTFNKIFSILCQKIQKGKCTNTFSKMDDKHKYIGTTYFEFLCESESTFSRIFLKRDMLKKFKTLV